MQLCCECGVWCGHNLPGRLGGGEALGGTFDITRPIIKELTSSVSPVEQPYIGEPPGRRPFHGGLESRRSWGFRIMDKGFGRCCPWWHDEFTSHHPKMRNIFENLPGRLLATHTPAGRSGKCSRWVAPVGQAVPWAPGAGRSTVGNLPGAGWSTG